MTTVESRRAHAPRTSEMPPAERRRKWLRDMMLIREFELRTMQAYQDAKIGGFCHIYIGQEAVAVGCVASVNDEDPVITAYRDHGHALARGTEPHYLMAEMFGKTAGCAKGKGGSMHFFDRRTNFYGGHAIVGGQCPLGTGLAFATKYENEVLGKGSKRVTLCFLGDGALNQGAFHEAMNLATVLQLPVIFLVENNKYAMGTSIERGTSLAHDLPTKAAGYDMPGYTIDGADVVELYQKLKPIADRCREEQKPAFVEIKCYRYKGHSMSDPQKYRSKDEVSEYEKNDSIRRLADQLIEENELTEDDFKSLSKEIRAEVRDAIKWAEEQPDASVEDELYADVFMEPRPPFLPTTPPMMLDQRLGEIPDLPSESNSDSDE